jgi:hypothetical protein
LAKWTCIQWSTAHRRLTKSMQFVVKHLCWVPHRLKHVQLAERVRFSNQLLKNLRLVQHQSWQYLLILNESWLYLFTYNEIIWFRKCESLLERERHMIQTKNNRHDGIGSQKVHSMSFSHSNINKKLWFFCHSWKYSSILNHPLKLSLPQSIYRNECFFGDFLEYAPNLRK